MNKKKFTAVDAVIIVVILAAVVFGVFKTGILSGGGSQDAVISFDVLVTECEENVAEAISEGDVVSISNKEKDTATVKAVSMETSRAMTYSSDAGEYYMKELEEKKDLYITLEASAKQSDILIQVGTTPVKVGLDMPVRGKGYALSGYIVRIDNDK